MGLGIQSCSGMDLVASNEKREVWKAMKQEGVIISWSRGRRGV